jgi:hypothetical protein
VPHRWSDDPKPSLSKGKARALHALLIDDEAEFA